MGRRVADSPVHSGPALIRWIWSQHLRAKWPQLLAALGLMAVEGAAVGALSYIVRPMFDTIYPGAGGSAVRWVAVAVASVFILRALAGLGQKVIMSRLAEGLSADIQASMLAHLMRLDLQFFQSHPPGQLIERLRGDNTAFRALWPNIVGAFGRDAVSLLSLISVALWIDWRWTLVAVLGVPLVLGPLSGLQRRIRNTARTARGAAALLSTRLDEVFHGIATIQLTGSEQHESGRYRLALRQYFRAQVRSDSASAAIPALFDIVAALGFAGVMLYGGAQIVAGEKTIGEFMSFFTAMALVFEPLRRLGSVSGAWAQARANLERIRDVLDEMPRLTSPATPLPLPTSPEGPRLVLDHVSFAYGDAPVLNDASFIAEPGQTTAIVGPSGAGKTTVFQLLTRMADPTAGSVTLGGVDLRNLNLAELRGQFAVVSQDSALFDESLADNVRLGARDLTDAGLTRALTAANAAGFVGDMAQGAATPAGPRGSGLSGGQRQRISIARAMLRNAPILLLDEATSALDAQSETLVTEALARLAQGRTTLVIAHRLATVRQADKIVVMDRGRVVDQGRHDELLARGGLYADLYRLQFTD